LCGVEIDGDAHLALAAWCAMWLGARPERVLFSGGHLSRVFGVAFPDGRRAAIKIRPAERRLAGCAFVQEHLYHVGFPCPKLLVGPVPYGDGTGLVATPSRWSTGARCSRPTCPARSRHTRRCCTV
jgi:hypothetical protein